MPAASGAAPPVEFYARPAPELARDLIGCALLREGAGGVIVETEAYDESEPAAHSYGGPRGRARTLFGPPGTVYVYRSYGIHTLVNIVAGEQGRGAAVLIRALEPRWGLEEMIARRGTENETALCSGPGKLGQALGAHLDDDAGQIGNGPYELILTGAGPARGEIVSGPRIGISKATDLPWRFCLAGSEHVSRPRP